MIGRNVSHYKILEEIGAGGMGVVYKAFDAKLKRNVAIKFLSPSFTSDQEARQRFIQEAQSASALDHQNICTVHEISETEDKQMFIVMSLYEGETLNDKIEEERLTIEDVLTIIAQIAEGLAKAHEKGIIHRDIKPANIFITFDGIIKILDFGLAKLTGQTNITRKDRTAGTIAYMSPEQTSGKNIDHRTDIWSLGVIMYQLITGEIPFKGDYEQAIIYSILNEDPEPLNDLPVNIRRIVNRALEKDLNQRYASIKELLNDINNVLQEDNQPDQSVSVMKSMISFVRKPVFLISITFFIFIAIILAYYNYQQSKIKWAREVALTEIENRINLAGKTGLSSAFELATEVQKYIPDNTNLKNLITQCSKKVSIKSSPESADIFLKKYQDPDQEWQYLGKTPIDSIRIAMEFYRWKIEKSGFQIKYIASSKYNIPDTFNFRLHRAGEVPAGMIWINSEKSDIGKLPDFYFDKYEVTNKEYRKFVNSGGYRNKKYWKFQFKKNGNEISWEEGISLFVDKTGRPGPATWEAGDYPDGEDYYPVTGVSWYEAAAYAEFIQKSLPTIYHWSVAHGIFYPFAEIPSFLIVPQSNFNQKGPAKVGTFPGIGKYGAYDCAGNVREWCLNESREGRCIRGGAWNDPSYMSTRITQASPFDRAVQNGFRCVTYINRNNIPDNAFNPYQSFRENDDYRYVEPVSDEIFQVYKESFAYDKDVLNPEIIYRDESPQDWVKEKISFAAVYNNERIFAYLYLPKHVKGPYQTVIVFPHSGATRGTPSNDLEKRDGLEFFIKDGRALMYPVYKGTYERGGPEYWTLHGQVSTRTYFDLVIKLVLDFRRSVDYLETREEIDINKLAYYSYSWGGELVSIIASVEDRLKLNILNTGGMRGFDAGGKIYPLADPINYVTRVTIPTLMLNGEFDMIYQYDKVVKPMYNLLGTPKKDKHLITYSTDHFIPRKELIKESLNWLDRYFGPAK